MPARPLGPPGPSIPPVPRTRSETPPPSQEPGSGLIPPLRHSAETDARQAARSTAGIKKELAHLQGRAGRGPLRQAEKPLAGYLMSAAATGTKPGKQETLGALRDGLDTLHHARAAAPTRANVHPEGLAQGGRPLETYLGGKSLFNPMSQGFDKLQRGEKLSEAETALLRCLPDDFHGRLERRGMSEDEIEVYTKVVTQAAIARWLKTTVCDDLSSLATGRHVDKLRPGQGLDRFGHPDPGHAYLSQTLRGAPADHPDNVVLDPWIQDRHRMTPITREHAHFPNLEGEVHMPALRLDGKAAGMMQQDIAALEKSLAASPEVRKLLVRGMEEHRPQAQGMVAEARGRFGGTRPEDHPPGTVHQQIFANPPPYLKQEFRDGAKRELEGLASGESLHADSPLTPPLKRDILATGVARDLGFSVGEAKGVVSANGQFLGDAARVLGHEPPAAAPPASLTPAPQVVPTPPVGVSGATRRERFRPATPGPAEPRREGNPAPQARAAARIEDIGAAPVLPEAPPIQPPRPRGFRAKVRAFWSRLRDR